ncbi:hypothetical protein HE1_00255 [Holospora elegans E1]|uniref:Uncharacterized protein n=1 Tax=Holospora elegans E1 TaxID=1427503 RepID=A0A023DYR4_9PROT|nr:hypothetical protein [Holospora elegans]GAJ45937.1 hypothetical protein HE1_00255 [Holospora elegans E1]
MNKIYGIFLCMLVLASINSGLYAEGEEKNDWISKVVKEQVPQDAKNIEAIYEKISAALKGIKDPVSQENSGQEEQRAKDFFKGVKWDSVTEEELNKKVKEFLGEKKEEIIPEKKEEIIPEKKEEIIPEKKDEKNPEKKDDIEDIKNKIKDLEKENSVKKNTLLEEEKVIKDIVQSIKKKVAKSKIQALRDKVENIVSEVTKEMAEKIQEKISPLMFETVKKININEFHTALEKEIFLEVKKLVVDNQQKLDQEIGSIDQNSAW